MKYKDFNEKRALKNLRTCMVSGVPFRVVQPYTANAIPVMKTVIPCAHILTGKTCSHRRDPVLIGGRLFSKQGLPCTPPVLPCTGLQCTTVLRKESRCPKIRQSSI